MTTKKRLNSIDDIARLAGVSKSTVSRALNDSPLISVATKEKIVAIATEYDFRPSGAARALSLQSSKTIAYVIDAYDDDCGIESPFSLEIMGGAATGLQELGYDMLIAQADRGSGLWAEEYLGSGKVDGFILMTYLNKAQHIANLIELDAPFAVWGCCDEEPCCSVSSDNRRGGRLAGEHLLSIGRKRFAFIGGYGDDAEVLARLEGYESAIIAEGLSLSQELKATGDFTDAFGAKAMQGLLHRDGGIDAIFAAGDMLAIGAMRAIAESGRRVPEDIAVVGYDDLFVSAYTTPALTTISQHIADTGKTLARNIVARIERGLQTRSIIPVELVRRQSA